MTKKHFEWFASWLAQYDDVIINHDAIEDMVSYFEGINEKFDRDMFFAHVERMRD